MKRYITIGILIILMLVAVGPSSTLAQATVPVTITIYKLVELDDPDSGKPFSAAGDYYAKVRINGFPFERSPEESIDPGFGEGVIFSTPVTYTPFWLFTKNVDPASGQAIIEIQIFDADNPGFPLFDDDDPIDINPAGGLKDVTLIVDLVTGDWSGDVPLNQSFSQGGGGDGDRSKIFFDVSILSADGDADGDGLLDGWERVGLDNDGDGSKEVNLPGFGADPMHKDIFLEFDWMPGNAPTRSQIQAMKTAFANAPINAGTTAATLCNPDCGANAKANPDGQPGINLWVDTGGLTVVAAGEDGSGPASCTDGINNDGDGLADALDPDCVDSEDGAGVNSCTDGLDNGGDGLADAADPDCLVGDNFGGGNQVALAAITNLNAAFYAVKNAPGNNFNANRRLVFRYGISAVPGLEDGSGAANSCFDGIDNGPDGVADNQDPDCQVGGGWGEIGGNDFIEYNHDGGTIMHELGHTLNLAHGGNSGANCKPNYVSVMNYDNQFGINQAGGGIILDYSPPRFPGGRGNAPLNNLVENGLNEAVILDATDAVNRFVFSQFQANGSEDGAFANTCNDTLDNNGNGATDAADPACYQKVQLQLNSNGVNWDGIAGTGPANIDTSGNTNVFRPNPPPGAPNLPNLRPPACTNAATNSTLTGFNDWPNISIPFRQFGDAADGAINPVTDPEPTLQELLELQEQLNTTDIEVFKEDSADPAIAGTELTYMIEVENHGPNPASSVEVTDSLPNGTTHIANDGGCVEAPVGTLTCDLGEILANATGQFEITTKIDADLVYNAGGPTTISNSASANNAAGPDIDASNNSVTEDTLVIAVADLEIVSFEAVDPPAEILVGEDVNITLRKVIDNNGPSAPMDVKLTKSATAPTDSTVTPTSSTADEIALGLDEQREVFETFTINCGQASNHTFVFTNEIQPLNLEDTDPDQSNNSASLDLNVECVVPVAINIKAGSDPNSINLNQKGNVAVAVLTTVVGEYDTPLDFDATTIDPLSVRFGSLDAVWTETGGAFEVHGRGHIEDSLELDETTSDGDMDMVLHFMTQDTGITAGDTEACVKGSWTDVNSNVHKFLGCDAIRTVGK